MIIFFLDEKIRLNLQDFAAVVIINLAVSLFIALFLVPALIDKMNLHPKKAASSSPKARSHWKQHPVVRPIRSFIHRFPVYFSHYYRAQIRFLCNWKKLACLILVLAFGTTDILFAGEDRAGREGSIRKGLFVDRSLQ